MLTSFILGIATTFLCLEIVVGSRLELIRKRKYVKSVEELAGSGFSEKEVMCKTVSHDGIVGNDVGGSDRVRFSGESKLLFWESCGQTCNSNTLHQTKVDIRNFGSAIRFEGCTGDNAIKVCKDHTLDLLSCAKGECENLSGIFNCTRKWDDKMNLAIASCQNYTDLILCNLRDDSLGRSLNVVKELPYDNEGLYFCEDGTCSLLLRSTECKQLCSRIQTKGNIFVLNGDTSVWTLNCIRAVDAESAIEIWPRDSSREDNKLPIFTIYCTHVENDGTIYLGQDCFNGRFLKPDYFNESEVIDFQQLMEGVLTCGAISKNVPLDKELLVSTSVPLEEFC